MVLDILALMTHLSIIPSVNSSGCCWCCCCCGCCCWLWWPATCCLCLLCGFLCITAVLMLLSVDTGLLGRWPMWYLWPSRERKTCQSIPAGLKSPSQARPIFTSLTLFTPGLVSWLLKLCTIGAFETDLNLVFWISSGGLISSMLNRSVTTCNTWPQKLLPIHYIITQGHKTRAMDFWSGTAFLKWLPLLPITAHKLLCM